MNNVTIGVSALITIGVTSRATFASNDEADAGGFEFDLEFALRWVFSF
jgi:hypothetical protein